MKFVSKIDNVTFTSEKDLVNHLLKNFSLTVEQDDFADIIDKIKNELPYVEVKSVSKNNDNLIKINIHVKDEYGDLLFSETYYIGELNYDDDSHYKYYDDTVCEYVEDLILYINRYYIELEFLKELLSSTEGITTYKINDVNTARGYDNGGINYEFSNGKETFHKYYDFSDTRQHLMNQVRSEFNKEIEGVVENYWDSCENRQIFRINGVELRNFLKNNTNVKITILD